MEPMLFDAATLRQATKGHLEPYGFRKFRVHADTEGLVVIHCNKGVAVYVATYHVSMLTNPPTQTLNPMGEWTENVCWHVLRSSWGKHRKT